MLKANIEMLNVNLDDAKSVIDGYFSSYILTVSNSSAVATVEADTTEKSMRYAVDDCIADLSEVTGYAREIR